MRLRPALGLAALVATLALTGPSCVAQERPAAGPRIVNIVNFIRLLEPRSEEITEQVLYDTVARQVDLMQRFRLPGTFLLQYDALVDDRYQKLLKSLPEDQFEVGAWWELPQPLVEKAGLPWRGRFPWDWHANVGFASGYTPEEREKLVDVYMADFHAVFGRYPKSVASWFIDAHTLRYLHEEYGVIASANCKDQIGTDGYTLWGGYWNQAYYPSKLNAYMPAQTEAGQIPVPVFRMLGSDPLRQYDTGVGGRLQGVISLEPVYDGSGGDPAWVDWFLKNFAEGECLAFNYAQAGQENSFTWSKMSRGLIDQFHKIAVLRDEGKLRVETLGRSGAWFRERFRTTPATAMSFTSPLGEDNRRAFWFNSRYYRANLVWDNGSLWVRDLHLFDESVESEILRKNVDRPAVEFHTLPLVDGNHWSTRDTRAGLIVTAPDDGEELEVAFAPPQAEQTADGAYRLVCPLDSGEGTLEITMREDALTFAMKGAPAGGWRLRLVTAAEATTPFERVDAGSVACSYKGFRYTVDAAPGAFEPSEGGFRLLPDGDTVTLRLKTR